MALRAAVPLEAHPANFAPEQLLPLVDSSLLEVADLLLDHFAGTIKRPCFRGVFALPLRPDAEVRLLPLDKWRGYPQPPGTDPVLVYGEPGYRPVQVNLVTLGTRSCLNIFHPPADLPLGEFLDRTLEFLGVDRQRVLAIELGEGRPTAFETGLEKALPSDGLVLVYLACQQLLTEPLP
jgi:hypothetical protein